MDAQLDLFRESYRLREKISAQARQVRIEVRSAEDVVLVIPRTVPRIEALAFLRSREDWIRDKLALMATRESTPPPPPARWDGADRIFLRGVETKVELVPATLRQVSVRMEAESITVFCPPALRGNHAKLARALREELIHQARLDAKRWLDIEAARLGVRYNELQIHDPKTLWGSCNPGAVICLSWRLVMAPPAVLRYVVVHELCHLVHMNHSARYWALVERQFPNYGVQKDWLRLNGHRLHSSLS